MNEHIFPTLFSCEKACNNNLFKRWKHAFCFSLPSTQSYEKNVAYKQLHDLSFQGKCHTFWLVNLIAKSGKPRDVLNSELFYSLDRFPSKGFVRGPSRKQIVKRITDRLPYWSLVPWISQAIKRKQTIKVWMSPVYLTLSLAHSTRNLEPRSVWQVF